MKIKNRKKEVKNTKYCYLKKEREALVGKNGCSS